MIERSRAIVLGAVQGPTELLPVSSSAHLTLIPWLAGWDPDDRDPELDKSFGVALHAGAAAALLIGQRQVIAEELRTFDARKAGGARPLVPAPGDPRRGPRAADRAAARRTAGDRRRPARRRRGDVRRRPPAAAAGPRPRDGRRRARARPRPGGRAGPGRLAERRHAERRPLARLHPPARRTCSRARSPCR